MMASSCLIRLAARRTILDRLSNRLTEIIAQAKSLGHR